MIMKKNNMQNVVKNITSQQQQKWQFNVYKANKICNTHKS